MRAWVLAGLMAFGPAAPGQAGAWMREAGEGFSAESMTLRGGAGRDEAGVFAEYGLHPGATVGLDLNASGNRNGHAVAFLRVPLMQWEHGGRLAVQAGLGAHKAGSVTGGMGKLSLLYGQPLGHGGTGWFGVEATVEHRSGISGPIYKLDTVAGLPVSGRVQPMIKLESTYVDGFGLGWSITPALIVKTDKGPRWVAGVEYRRGGGQTSLGLTLGIWRRF